ncbi:diguanylate cyclase [Methylobacterium ajmalii]|uniref:diguanylate cyclase n=1 Tax=Methylobacterium ajmalii TaxID=2738439 RepID=A0ABU9ZYT5_9HYPH
MHIVIIDTSRVVHRSISTNLAVSGHQVTCFADSRAALDHIIADETVSCVLTSLETYPLDGFELCWQLRVIANERRPLAILMMSTGHSSRRLGEVLDSGADDFLSKPPDRHELAARLRAAERLLGLQRDLIHQADTDSLSRLLNRSAFLRQAHILAQSQDREGNLVALLIDIDHFKSINDRYGHAIGDAAICSVASVLRETGALSCRWGGEEFAVLVHGHGQGGAAVVAHSIRRRCAQLQIATLGDQHVCLTVSIGISTWSNQCGMDDLMRRADVALYAAKAAGRNRVSMMSSSEVIECID